MRILGILLLSLLTAAPAPSAGTSAAALVQGRFRLLDARDGKPTASADFKGKVQVVFFGFTHCRLTCPVGLQRLAQVLDALGGDAGQVVPLFITTDPKRDTAGLMRDYAANFSAQIIPLVGSEKAIHAAMRSFRLEAEKVEMRSEDEYQMEHPAIFYVMDKNGRFATTLPSNGDAKELATRIRSLLKRGKVRR